MPGNPKPRKATKKTAPRSAPRKAAQARAKTATKPDTNEYNPQEHVSVAEGGFNATPLTIENGQFPAPAPEVNHPYGDTPVFIFQPADGSDVIVFPRVGTLPVTAKFMWKIYDLNELFQSFEWMKLANVPRDIQERVIDLPMVDRSRFWTSWFNDVTSPLDLSRDTMGPPGESSS
jgi:hypothetical protein